MRDLTNYVEKKGKERIQSSHTNTSQSINGAPARQLDRGSRCISAAARLPTTVGRTLLAHASWVAGVQRHPVLALDRVIAQVPHTAPPHAACGESATQLRKLMITPGGQAGLLRRRTQARPGLLLPGQKAEHIPPGALPPSASRRGTTGLPTCVRESDKPRNTPAIISFTTTVPFQVQARNPGSLHISPGGLRSHSFVNMCRLQQ